MGSFFHDDYIENELDLLLLDEFVFYEKDKSYRGTCPNCVNRMKIRSDADKIRCRNCDSKFRVN